MYNGDRFIPFRGANDNFLEEYIMNNVVRTEKT